MPSASLFRNTSQESAPEDNGATMVSLRGCKVPTLLPRRERSCGVVQPAAMTTATAVRPRHGTRRGDQEEVEEKVAHANDSRFFLRSRGPGRYAILDRETARGSALTMS